MKRADDVVNLFQSFGANTDSYLEIDSHFEYKEQLSELRPAIMSVVTADTSEYKPVDIPPALAITPSGRAVPATIGEPSSTPSLMGTSPTSFTPAPLRTLLAEVELLRQGEAQARNDNALEQSLSKGEPPVINAHVIAVVSAKGGVGKSTLSAALATRLRIAGGQTLAVDLDPQNALLHHLDVSPDVAGMGNASLRGENWRSLLLPGSAGTHLLPYGALSEDERRALDQYLLNDNYWLARQLARMELGEKDVVVLDTPPGRTVYLDQALAMASQVVVVISCDAASYITLTQIEQLLAPRLACPRPPVCSYVINEFDASRGFSRDMLAVLKRHLGDRLLGVVHLDHAINEALAYGRNPAKDPCETEGCQDLANLCRSLTSQLMSQDVKESQAL